MALKRIPSVDGYWHTFCPELLEPEGWVLDAGCRGFDFSTAMLAYGCKVVALDPAPDVEIAVPASAQKFFFKRAALSNKDGVCIFIPIKDVMASYATPFMRLAEVKPEKVPSNRCQCFMVQTLMREYFIPIWDCVKLDIEGSEYSVLASWPGPIAKQISVEFHHDRPELLPPRDMAPIYQLLDRWYTQVTRDDLDTLFVLKELAHLC